MIIKPQGNYHYWQPVETQQSPGWSIEEDEGRKPTTLMSSWSQASTGAYIVYYCWHCSVVVLCSLHVHVHVRHVCSLLLLQNVYMYTVQMAFFKLINTGSDVQIGFWWRKERSSGGTQPVCWPWEKDGWTEKRTHSKDLELHKGSLGDVEGVNFALDKELCDWQAEALQSRDELQAKTSQVKAYKKQVDQLKEKSELQEQRVYCTYYYVYLFTINCLHLFPVD